MTEFCIYNRMIESYSHQGRSEFVYLHFNLTRNYEMTNPIIASEEPSLDLEPNANPLPVEAEQLKNSEQISVELNKSDITDARENLNKIIASFQHHQSLLSQAADLWHNLSLWKKIGVGLVLIAPLFLLGVILFIPLLTTFSIGLMILYTACSYLLDDHYSTNDSSMNELKEGVYKLGDLLDTILVNLDQLSQEFDEQLDKLKMENSSLANNVTEFSLQLEHLTSELDELSEANNKFRNINGELQNTSNKLNEQSKKYADQLELSEKQLAEVIAKHSALNSSLLEQISQLVKENEHVHKEVQKMSEVSQILRKLSFEMSKHVLAGKESQDILMKKIDEFITNGNESLEHLVGKLNATTDLLRENTDSFKDSNERYKQLLDQQESQNKRFEKVLIKLEQSSNSSKLLQQVGLYGSRKPNATKKEPSDTCDNSNAMAC